MAAGAEGAAPVANSVEVESRGTGGAVEDLSKVFQLGALEIPIWYVSSRGESQRKFKAYRVEPLRLRSLDHVSDGIEEFSPLATKRQYRWARLLKARESCLRLGHP